MRIPGAAQRGRFDRIAEHDKIDAISVALADLMQHQVERDPEVLERHIEELRAAVGLERRM